MADTGRGLIGIIFSLAIILAVSGVFAGYWSAYLEQARSVALENELTNLRNSLQLYIILEGHYPEDLRELNKKRNVLGHSRLYGKRYLELQAQDKDGYPVDPYGRLYIYDNKTGKVRRRGRDETGK